MSKHTPSPWVVIKKGTRMNANELASAMDSHAKQWKGRQEFRQAAAMLRQLQADKEKLTADCIALHAENERLKNKKKLSSQEILKEAEKYLFSEPYKLRDGSLTTVGGYKFWDDDYGGCSLIDFIAEIRKKESE